MASTIDKVKHALHMDKSHSTGTTHNEGQHGPHQSRMANAADPRVDSDRDGSHTVGNTNYGSTNAGPHSSNLVNKADPTVDSDRDGSYTLSGGNTHGTGSTNYGPHSSNMANKMDPRIDSDRDGSHNIGGNTGFAGGISNSTNAGPHNSNLANKMDPRVDSGNTGFTGGISNSTNAGPHNSNLANKMDPRVDSDLDGRGNRHGTTGGVFGASGSHATAGHGTAQNTAGPHNSDMMNKLDPRVDSDRDGSNTLGRDRTFA